MCWNLKRALQILHRCCPIQSGDEVGRATAVHASIRPDPSVAPRCCELCTLSHQLIITGNNTPADCHGEQPHGAQAHEVWLTDLRRKSEVCTGNLRHVSNNLRVCRQDDNTQYMCNRYLTWHRADSQLPIVYAVTFIRRCAPPSPSIRRCAPPSPSFRPNPVTFVRRNAAVVPQRYAAVSRAPPPSPERPAVLLPQCRHLLQGNVAARRRNPAISSEQPLVASPSQRPAISAPAPDISSAALRHLPPQRPRHLLHNDATQRRSSTATPAISFGATRHRLHSSACRPLPPRGARDARVTSIRASTCHRCSRSDAARRVRARRLP